VKNPEVLLINRFEIPMMFGIYDFDEQKVVKIATQVNPGQAMTLPREFFANNLKEVMKNDQQKFVVGCAYASEIRGPKDTQFMPNWKGVVLETKDVILLSTLFKDVNAVLCSMFLLGEFPVVFFNAPEVGAFTSIPCGELRTVFGSSYDTIKNIFESTEFYRLLWASAFGNPEQEEKKPADAVEKVDTKTEDISVEK